MKFRKLILFTVLLISILIVVVFGFDIQNDMLIYPSAFMILVISVFLCYIYRNDIGLFLPMLFMAYCNYSIVVGVYISHDLESIYAQFSYVSYAKALICLLLFELILLLLSTKSFWKYKEYFKIIPVKNNSIIAYGSIVAFLIVFFYFFSLGTEGARGGTKSVGEYRVLIMIIGLFFSNRQTKIKKIWTIVIIVTSVLVLISGNRVDIIAPIILLICFCYHDVVNYKKILSFFPLFVILFLFIGFVRGDRSKLYETRGEIQSVFQNFTDSKLVFSTPVWAYVPSVATIELTDKVDFKEKNQMFFEYLSYIFYAGFARSIDKTDFELSYYTGQYFSHNNGFVSPIYFFFWLGYLGVLLFAVLLKIYIVIYQHCFKAVVADYKSGLQYCVGFYFISSVGRWYLFGPHLLIRGMFILIVLYSAVYLGSLFLNRPLLPDEKSV